MSFIGKTIAKDLARRYVDQGLWDNRTLGQYLAESLEQDPGRKFRIWSPTNPYTGTVGDAYDQASRLATGLSSIGVKPGDVVAFQLPNWFEGAVTFYACALLGVVIVPIVHFYGPKEVGFILKESKAKVLIQVARMAKRDYLGDLAKLRPGLPHLKHVVVVRGEAREGDHRFEDLVASPQIPTPQEVDPDSPALIGYTSGTTADPKGVIHSHRTLGFEVRQLGAHQDERDEPYLTGAPIGHAMGMLSGLLIPLTVGKPIYITDGWDPQTVLDAMVEENIGAGNGSTYFMTSLLDAPGFTPKHLARMKMISLGGSPIPDAVADRARDLGISLTRAYGCTEHPSVTGSKHGAPEDEKLHTDGRPLAHVEVRTVDEEGQDSPTGLPGEIITRGPDRFLGYSDPGLNVSSIDHDGWFHTGDVGILDTRGCLTVTDRVKDIIIRGGENVSAAEVEGVLAHMDGVAEVAVVAAPDQRLGEHGCAFFRLRDGVLANSIDMDAMRTHLATSGLARQKWPEEVRIVKEFPRTASGKVQKFVLRNDLREEP